MSATRCLPECDEQHADDCPAYAAEMAYWARYFGQNRGTRQQRQATLRAMDPRGPSAEDVQDMRDAGRIS
jgi:hypothetical protein